MPRYESAEQTCPECGAADTQINRSTDRFLCGNCNFSAPEAELLLA